MTMKKTKTVLFGSIFAALILTLMVGQVAEASTTYTRQQVTDAFALAGDHVTFNAKNKMKVDKASMSEDGMSSDDIKIVKQYARLHNKLIKAMIAEDKDAIATAKDNLHNGKFALVFNDPNATAAPSVQAASGAMSVAGFLDDSACGITNGDTSTYPGTPTIILGATGHSTQSAIETWLVNNDQHKVSWPYADWGDIVYAEKNSTGQGGCTSGEFRDEWHVYDASVAHTYNGVTSTGWHTLNQYNEPNSEVLDYVSPTYWWIGFVSYWHDNY